MAIGNFQFQPLPWISLDKHLFLVSSPFVNLYLERVHLNSCLTVLTWNVACWQGSRYLGICHGMLEYLWPSDRCLPVGFWLERNSKEYMENCWLDSPLTIFISQSGENGHKAWSCSPRILQYYICMCFFLDSKQSYHDHCIYLKNCSLPDLRLFNPPRIKCPSAIH